MSDQIRYHVFRSPKRQRRTTVVLDKIVSDLLCLKLGYAPDSEAGRAAVRSWIQEQVDCYQAGDRERLSQWLRRRAILAIADPELVKQFE